MSEMSDREKLIEAVRTIDNLEAALEITTQDREGYHLMFCEEANDVMVLKGQIQLLEEEPALLRKIIYELRKDLAWATIHLMQELLSKSDRRFMASQIRKKYKLHGELFVASGQEEQPSEFDETFKKRFNDILA